MLKRLLIIDILVLQFLFSFSQTKIDSLYQLLSISGNDTAKAMIMLDISLQYMEKDNQKAIEWIDRADSIASKLKFDPLTVKVYYKKGINSFYISQYHQAIDNFNKALPLFRKIKDPLFAAKTIEWLGKCNFRLTKFEEAVTYNMEALKIYLELKNSTGISACYKMIGTVYASQGKYTQALEFFNKTLTMVGYGPDQIISRARIYSNISSTYVKMKEYKKALSYFDSIVPIYIQIDDKYSLAQVYNNFGVMCTSTHDFTKARKYLVASMQLAEQSGNVTLLLVSYNSMAEFYNKINKCDSAILLLKRCLELNKPLQLNDRYLYIYGDLYETYEKMGDTKNALFYYKLFTAVNDTLAQELSKKKLFEVQTQYEVELKNRQIELLNTKNEIQFIQLSRQRILTYFIFALAAFLCILAFVSYNRYLLKKKNNQLLLAQNAEIYQQKEEITAQRDEIEAQRDIVFSQKKQIELIHKELTSSIDYAYQIQTTLLPPPSILNELFTEHFVLFKPRNIVSGDFYWAKRINHQLVFCVADCTGHGVPGSLMSMLGISFLNEIVRNMDLLKPDQILNQLRESVVAALQQKGIRGEHKDGMDIALCVLDTTTLKLQFAGAMNPCWIIKNEGHADKQLMVMDPRLMPVAIHIHMEAFSSQEIQLQKGDLIYLFSDGFTDQNGGEKNKKLQTRQFKDLLLVNCHENLNNQKTLFDRYFEQWRGNNAQLDDVTLMGVKI